MNKRQLSAGLSMLVCAGVLYRALGRRNWNAAKSSKSIETASSVAQHSGGIGIGGIQAQHGGGMEAAVCERHEDSSWMQVKTALNSTIIRTNLVPIGLLISGTAWLVLNNVGITDHVASTASDMGRRVTDTASDIGRRASELAAGAAQKVGLASSGDRALGHTGHPMVDRDGEQSEGWVHQVSDQASGALRSARDTSGALLNRVGSYAGAGGISQTFERNPLIIGAIGVMTGALVAALVPFSEIENELLGETRDELWQRAEDFGEEAVQRVREAATEAAVRAVDAATGAAASFPSAATVGAGGAVTGAAVGSARPRTGAGVSSVGVTTRSSAGSVGPTPRTTVRRVREATTEAPVRAVDAVTRPSADSVSATPQTAGRGEVYFPPPEPPDESAGQTADAADVPERHLNVWLRDRSGGPAPMLRVGLAYLLNLNLGSPEPTSLSTSPQVRIPRVLPGGLETEWLVRAIDAELDAPDAVVRIAQPPDGSRTWSARFALHLPETGDSETRRLTITPHSEKAKLEIVIRAQHEIWRECAVELPVEKAITPLDVLPFREEIHSKETQLGLKAPFGWMTPPGALIIRVSRYVPEATVWTDERSKLTIDEDVPWTASHATMDLPIKRLRSSAEKFREVHSDYLDSIDARAIETSNFDPPGGEPAADLNRWEQVARSDELRKLAIDGRDLADAVFEPGTKLRQWIESLEPGHRVGISWTKETGEKWVPHVPWGLMYLGDIPPRGDPVDPYQFLGLRYRIHYRAHAVRNPSKALGSLDRSHRAVVFYWDGDDADVTWREANWQRELWSKWWKLTSIPAILPQAPKEQVIAIFENPAPPPTTIIYFFCECMAATRSGGDWVLRFGKTNDSQHTLGRYDLGRTPFAHPPLIFANACTTAAADAYMANELETSFFQRGCRAFIGTETKVPVVLASRFATIFFRLLFSTSRIQAISAGEALYQARRFLWHRFHNIGGLFYSYVNEYDLFVADEEEVQKKRVTGGV